MTKTIHVIIKQNYGADHIYPNCHESKLLAELAGTKTLTPHALSAIKKLGYTIAVDLPRRTQDIMEQCGIITTGTQYNTTL